MYSEFTEDELIEAYTTMIDYSGKASNDILEEINQRGGLDNFLQEIEQKKINKNESNRVLNEIIRLNKEEHNLESIKQNITSEIWTKQHLNAFIENRYIRHQLYLNDKSIDKELIAKSFIATVLASFAGTGILIVFIALLKISNYGILIFVYFISYLIIKGYTGKTHNNGIVFLAGLISTIISGVIAFLVFTR